MVWDLKPVAFMPKPKKSATEYNRQRREKAEVQKQLVIRHRVEHDQKWHREIYATLKTPEFHSWYEAIAGEPWDLPDDALVRRIQGQIDHVLLMEECRIRMEKIAPPEKVAITFDLLRDAKPSERRRIMVMLATPRWADKTRMKEIYAERRRLTEETGEMHHVDHIIPIQGKYVCGLHCEANLQILTATANLRKNNKFTVGDLLIAA